MSYSHMRASSPLGSLHQPSPPTSPILRSTSTSSQNSIHHNQHIPTTGSSGPGDHLSPPASPVVSNVASPVVSQNNIGAQTSTKTTKPKRAIEWWWWWEIGASLLSLTSLVLIVAVLAVVNNKRLDDWKLAIQPNSLIAVLTTVGKTAMMVPIASMLSQLKWSHFNHSPHPLNHLQIFDDASRGPWGAFMLFYSMRAKVILAWGCAFVTIVGLGIEPSAQQILSFDAKPTRLTNQTTYIGIAENYFSKAFVSKGPTGVDKPTADLLPFQAAIINSAAGSIFQPTLKCDAPATQCRYGDFTSLAICAETKDITQFANVTCTAPNSKANYNCTYTFMDPFSSTGRSVEVSMSYTYLTGGVNQPDFEIFKAVSVTTQGLTTLKVTDTSVVNAGGKIPPIEASHTQFSWCAQTFKNVTVNAAQEISFDSVTSEQLDTRNGISNDGFHDQAVMPDAYIAYRANSNGRLYNVTRVAQSNIFIRLTRLFEGTVVEIESITQRKAGSLTGLNMAPYLQNTKIPDVAQRIANGATNAMRNNSPNRGDNSYATMLSGEAWFNDIYATVRWPWIILPLAEIVLTCLLLAISIISTRKDPLWKSSIAAFFVHGLNGWREDEFEIAGKESAEKLELLSEKMIGSLQQNIDGRLKFFRT